MKKVNIIKVKKILFLVNDFILLAIFIQSNKEKSEKNLKIFSEQNTNVISTNIYLNDEFFKIKDVKKQLQ